MELAESRRSRSFAARAVHAAACSDRARRRDRDAPLDPAGKHWPRVL